MRKPASSERGRTTQAKREAVRGAKKMMDSHSSTSQRRKALEDAAWWVLTHPIDARLEGGGSAELRRVLMEMKKRDPVAFLKSVMVQVLPAASKAHPLPPEDVEEDPIGYAQEHLDRFLAELNKKPRPVTGAADGAPNGSQAA